jgi:MYXO-CTERM domain-containing protein
MRLQARLAAVGCLLFLSVNTWASLSLPTTGSAGIGLADTNYKLSYDDGLGDPLVPLTAYGVANQAPGAWINAPAGSQWIEPIYFDSPYNIRAGDYYYELDFSIPGLLSVSGQFTSDNNAEILLNGVSTGITTPFEGYNALYSFSLTSGFTANNKLVFHVSEDGLNSPTGLLVAALTAEVTPPPPPPPPPPSNPVPAPGAAVLVLIGLGMIRRRVR